jgi:hypothetical protein
VKIRVISFISGMVLLASAAFAQGVRYDDVVLLDSGRPVQGASITVCASGSSGTPCTPTTSIFSDLALGSPITQPGFQSGAQGNFFFYAACGKYDISFSGNGLTSRTKKDVQLGPCGSFNATLKRVTESQGTALTSGRFALSGAWGTTASVLSISGTDGAFSFRILASGTGQSVNPIATVTFADGTWTNPPICVISNGDQTALGTSTVPNWSISGTTATALTIHSNRCGYLRRQRDLRRKVIN